MQNDYIPWYQMPIRLRALPFNERAVALKEYVQEFGAYDWQTKFDIDEYKDQRLAAIYELIEIHERKESNNESDRHKA